MIGLKRRKRVEGWALDVPESDGEGAVDLRQRIADNNKLWIAALACVVLLTLIFMRFANKGPQPKHIGGPRPAPSNYTDQSQYTRLANELTTEKRYKDSVRTARFLSPGQLQLVVASTVSADEVDYISKMAAEEVRTRFRHRVVVQVYMNDSKDGSRSLIATTQWEPKKYGFVVKYHSGSSRLF